ncbi:MAG: membrane protein insertase YidC, partial [Pseudomonadota bacterium]
FDLLIDWGWFYFITKPMFYLLQFFHGLVGNFGFAIILATVVIKLVFFPLANKSYVSMSKMKKLQPEMQKIKERFGDDRQRQQQAMMELYKKEKVNPISGCLPVLIQIPVFFALYKVLFGTIDMRHAPFIGWIQDLSAKDPTTLFNLFGLLPFGVPDFMIIGVWPIIMGITMFIQMKLNPAPPDPIQAQIFAWMPLFFTFLLASFPAGLVIYWAWNNTLSVAQQYVIMRRQGVEVELWKNMSDTFSFLKKKGAKETE